MEAARRGLALAAEGDGNLSIQPADKCPQDFLAMLKRFKPDILALLRRNDFVLVDSKAVGEVLFFCEDETTKAALVADGAEEWRIYTRAELEALVAQNRIAPISAADLCKLHEIKKTFHAQITK
jgi:hypothetical protein